MTTAGSPPSDTVDRSREPVLLVVGADEHDTGVTATALHRRFAPDYRVLTAGSADAALEELERLTDQRQDVALVAADLHLPDDDGVHLLQQAATRHRGIIRVLLLEMDDNHTRVPFSELPALQRATALGQIDLWMVKGWVDPEEWLYPQIQEALSAWSRTHGPSHVVYRVVGGRWDPHTHQLRDGLTLNGVPFVFHPSDSAGGQRLIRDHGIDAHRLPAAIRHDGTVLQEPSMVDLARSHGVQVRPNSSSYDLAVVGAGPAGLAAAVSGASEGLRTLVLEARAIGGQAGTSSLIRNYLGFPRGINGGELAHRAWQQSVLFGADFVFTNPVTALTSRGGRHELALADAGRVSAGAVILATGVTYRSLGIPALDRLVGAGVFYGAAGTVAPAMTDEQVYVVGGANSAGQAALHLAQFAARVTLLVRGPSLTAGMSAYLVRQIAATPNVDVRLSTQVIGGRGTDRLEGLTLRNVQSGTRQDVPAAALFILIGAEPGTDWLSSVLSRDQRGFVLTGRDLPPAAWPLPREPFPFETSLPGVFAAGDVRYGSVKRVAGAAGEGSVAVGSVHRYLADPVADPPPAPREAPRPTMHASPRIPDGRTLR